MRPYRVLAAALVVAGGVVLPVHGWGCTVALDVGHSRASAGATSARGIGEWHFNQKLAIHLAETLINGGITVHVVNPGGDAIALKARPQSALAAGADLLLSVHHDSVQPHYLMPWTWQGRQHRYSDHFSGYGLFVSGKNAAFTASRRVAADLADSLRQSGLKPSLHHAEPISGENRPLLDAERGIYQYDDLVVLKYALMPAVLIEAGLIVNRDEELRVSQPEYQAMLATAVLGAVKAHCRRPGN
jgi:N-acetylmuramoyl-L-alanine amidase